MLAFVSNMTQYSLIEGHCPINYDLYFLLQVLVLPTISPVYGRFMIHLLPIMVKRDILTLRVAMRPFLSIHPLWNFWNPVQCETLPIMAPSFELWGPDMAFNLQQKKMNIKTKFYLDNNLSLVCRNIIKKQSITTKEGYKWFGLLILYFDLISNYNL